MKANDRVCIIRIRQCWDALYFENKDICLDVVDTSLKEIQCRVIEESLVLWEGIKIGCVASRHKISYFFNVFQTRKYHIIWNDSFNIFNEFEYFSQIIFIWNHMEKYHKMISILFRNLSKLLFFRIIISFLLVFLIDEDCSKLLQY